jgi:hypothetical protein
MKNLFSLLKPKKDIEFVDTKKLSYHNFSVERAIDVPTNTRKVQQDKYGKHLMPYCPGILDYAQFGYIIPAWVWQIKLVLLGILETEDREEIADLTMA